MLGFIIRIILHLDCSLIKHNTNKIIYPHTWWQNPLSAERPCIIPKISSHLLAPKPPLIKNSHSTILTRSMPPASESMKGTFNNLQFWVSLSANLLCMPTIHKKAELLSSRFRIVPLSSMPREEDLSLTRICSKSQDLVSTIKNRSSNLRRTCKITWVLASFANSFKIVRLLFQPRTLAKLNCSEIKHTTIVMPTHTSSSGQQVTFIAKNGSHPKKISSIALNKANRKGKNCQT